MHSASLAADGEPVFEMRSPGARPERLGVSLGSPLSVGTHGRFALGAGGDRIAWTAKHIVTCAGGRCEPLRSPPGKMTLEPAWSPDGRRLAYVTAANFFFVARDGLWLLPRLGGRPVRVAEPLFWPGRWPNYYGQVDWADQFAWHS
jgi:hypothetical protein